MESVVQSQNRREQELHKQLHEIEDTTNTSMETLRHRESELECSREREEGLKAELEYQSRRLQELYKQLHEMEAEKNSHMDNFMHNKNELAYSQEREKRLAGELETARHRVKRLEANFEAERSAHLVSKLNSEMIQMWAQDLESSFQVEKDKYSQIASDSEMIKNQFNEMNTAYKREKTRADENAEKLKRLDEEFSSLTNQLKSEIDEKNRLATEFSSKLKNIEECHMKVEEDFAEAKKRHSCLEESYGSNMRELQSMVESFNVSSQRTSGIYNDKVQAADPAAVLQTLRHTLTDYQSRLEGTSNELETTEKLCVQMSEELESFIHKIQSLGTNLENMQSELREVNMELSHLRSKYADKESQIGSIQKDLAESQHGWEKEKLRVMEAEKEIQNLTRTYQKDTENMQSDLREVNMELSHLRSKYADKESQIGSIQKDLAESQHGWEKEKLRVMEAEKEIQNLTRTYQKDTENMQSDLREVNMELSHLRSKYAEKESQIGSIQKDLAESQHGWEKEKLRVMEAEKEIQNLTRTYQKDTEENQTFLHGLYQRLLARGVLIKQPESMLDQFSWSELCLVLQENVDVLISDLNRANEKLSHLEYVCNNKSDAMMELQKSHEDSLNKLAAEMKAQDRCWQKQWRDLEQHYSALLSEVQARAQNMQSELREVNMELSHLRSKYADKESQIGSIQKDLAESQHGWEKEKLRVMEAEKEIQYLTRTYQKDTKENQTFLHSLYQRLLSRCVLIQKPETMLDKFSWSELRLVLQENVDVLISDLNRANEKLSHLEYVCKNKSDAMMELQKSHEDSLNKLAAEMKAQDRCWQKQWRDLEQHYSALLSEVQARAQGLSEAKQELRRKDQSLRQLTRKLSQLEQDKNRLEQDKNRLEESIHNSESDLRMAAKDREFLANHMKSVEIVFQKVRDQISLSWFAPIRNDFTVHLPKLHSEIFAVEGHLGGSEFTICQNMIRSFLDVYQLAWSKTTALEREIASHQKHIADLKSELQTACRGGNARLPTPVDYDRNSELSARSESWLDKTTEPDFLPINAGTENHSSHMKYGYVASRSYSTRSPVFSPSTSPM